MATKINTIQNCMAHLELGIRHLVEWKWDRSILYTVVYHDCHTIEGRCMVAGSTRSHTFVSRSMYST